MTSKTAPVTRKQLDDALKRVAELVEAAEFTGKDELLRARDGVAAVRKQLRSCVLDAEQT